MMERRDTLVQAFLNTTSWAKADRHPLVADASSRSYERLTLGDQNAILMNAPYEAGEDVRPFVKVTKMLTDANLSAPQIIARDINNGFLLLEDLGNDLYAKLCEMTPEIETQIYGAAIDVLATLHKHSAPANLPPYDIAVYLREAQLLTQWYIPAANKHPLTDQQSKIFDQLAKDVFSTISTQNPVLVMRDYHAENLLWLPQRDGVSRVGLLDYQDALSGHAAYDLVSLLEDARRDTSDDLRRQMIKRYMDQTAVDPDAFLSAYAMLGAQRNIKIIGIFARLCLRDGKTHYIDLIPRVWDHLMRDLKHPSCAALKTWIMEYVAPPTPTILQNMVHCK